MGQLGRLICSLLSSIPSSIVITSMLWQKSFTVILFVFRAIHEEYIWLGVLATRQVLFFYSKGTVLDDMRYFEENACIVPTS